MKQIKTRLLIVGFLVFLPAVLFAQTQACDPDLSIENQKAKKISKQAQGLLVKILDDQIAFTWPIEVCKCWVSSLFGPRKSGFHNGLDLAAIKGTPVFAVADGTVQVVQKSADKNGYGNMVIIDHKKIYFTDAQGYRHDYKTRYGHLHKIVVEQGQQVKKGAKIGTVGSTGHVHQKTPTSDPSHLHFEVYRGPHRVDPLICLLAGDRDWVQKNLKQ